MVLGMALTIGGVLVGLALLLSIFGGGGGDSGCGTLLCWQGTPILEGIDLFITGIFNFILFVSVWVAIVVVGMIFLAVNIMFIYFYYKLAMWMWGYRGIVQRFFDEISRV